MTGESPSKTTTGRARQTSPRRWQSRQARFSRKIKNRYGRQYTRHKKNTEKFSHDKWYTGDTRALRGTDLKRLRQKQKGLLPWQKFLNLFKKEE